MLGENLTLVMMKPGYFHNVTSKYMKFKKEKVILHSTISLNCALVVYKLDKRDMA